MTSSAGNIFRLSLYAAICLATTGMWMGEDNPLPYPWLVLFCAVAAYSFTDMWGMLKIPPALHVWLGVGIVALFVREEMANYQVDPVMPLGHLIVLSQIILLFHIKTPLTYWLLLLTAFLEVLIAALHNNRVGFGVLMGIFLILIVWTMTQFWLLRETERHVGINPGQSDGESIGSSAAGSIASSLVIFSAAMLLFFVIPRRGQTAWTQAPHRPGQYLSGFDERIRLGQLGTILESDEEVMTIRMFDELGQPYHPSEEPYWRGVALSYYEGGRWERQHVELDGVRLYGALPPDRYIRQEIRLQGVHRDVLFGMWPAFSGETGSGDKLAKMRDGTLVRPENVPTGPLQYTLNSVPGARVHLREELGPYLPDRNERLNERLKERLNELKQLPRALAVRLKEYAAEHGLTRSRGDEDFCRQVLNHLTDSNEFDYTLRQTKADPDLDPVLDFLFNRKEGHCEYFASSMALLLRAHDVPARVVNGFKGGDWNDLFGPSLVVRQKHAHSWVEVLLPNPDRPNDEVWHVFDPTPGPGRQRVAVMVNSTPSLFRQVRDISRQIWSNYVLNFNSSEQEVAVYAPFRRLVVEKGRRLAERARQLWEQRGSFNWVAAIGASLVTFLLLIAGRTILRLLARGQLISVQRSSTGFTGLLGHLLERLGGFVNRWLVSTSAGQLRVAFYDELVQRLESHGLSKQPTWTAKQFAQHAQSELERSSEATAAAQIPGEVVDRYYRVRFGHEPLSQSENEEIGRMLETLGNVLKVTPMSRRAAE